MRAPLLLAAIAAAAPVLLAACSRFPDSVRPVEAEAESSELAPCARLRGTPSRPSSDWDTSDPSRSTQYEDIFVGAPGARIPSSLEWGERPARGDDRCMGDDTGRLEDGVRVDVRDLVQPRGPYVPAALVRWIRDYVRPDEWSDEAASLECEDGRLSVAAPRDVLTAVKEFVDGVRARLAPPPAEEAPDVFGAHAETCVITHTTYIHDFDVEIAQSPGAPAPRTPLDDVR